MLATPSLFGLPAVAIQISLRNLARAARDRAAPLPDPCHGHYRIWLAFGFPAFFAILSIVWRLLTKPTF